MKEKLIIMKRLIEGLIYLGGKRIIHRDIKPDNILLNMTNIPKIIDLGSAVQTNSSRQYKPRICLVT